MRPALVGRCRGERPVGVVRVDGHRSGRLARLAVRPVAAAVRAVLLQFEPVGIVAPVLARDVVTVLALLAGQGDLGPDVGGSHDGVPFCRTDVRCLIQKFALFKLPSVVTVGLTGTDRSPGPYGPGFDSRV